MAEAFLSLTRRDQAEALGVAATASGRTSHVLEKDVWVVWSLATLFAGAHGEDLVFKGGTSLSKAYGVIDRFSEDIDITYDIRRLIGDLAGDADEPLPPTPSQHRKWRKAIDAALPAWINAEVGPDFSTRTRSGLTT